MTRPFALLLTLFVVTACAGQPSASPTGPVTASVVPTAARSLVPTPTAQLPAFPRSTKSSTSSFPSLAITPTSSSTSSTWHYVALGDSWPAGGHCGGCETFVGLWADDLQKATGRKVETTNLTGANEPGLPTGEGGGTSSSLLDSLRFNQTTQAAVRAADIILISTGGNDLNLVFDRPPAGGDCQGSLQLQCVKALGRVWATNFGAILDEIQLLRDGAPTVVRLVDSANPVFADPSMLNILSPYLAATNGALIFQFLHDAMCSAATLHGAACVDVRPIVNGPNMDQPGDENSPATMQAVADALMATGTAELTGAR